MKLQDLKRNTNVYTLLINKMDEIFATDKKKNLIDWSKNLPNNIIEIVDSYNNTK